MKITLILCMIRLIIVIPFLSGCESIYGGKLYMVDYRYAGQSGGIEHVKDLFGSGEMPTAVVPFPGQTVKLVLFNLTTEQQVNEVTKYIPNGQTWFQSYTNLGTGSYRVEAFVGGTLAATTSFTVQK